MIRIGLVGLGLIGQERIRAIAALRRSGQPVALDCCHDPHVQELPDDVKSSGAALVPDLESIIARQPDLVIIATPHDSAVSITKRLLHANLKVLIEKPLGRALTETCEIAACVTRPDQLWVGQNYRFFAGVAGMLEDLRAGWFGRPIGLSIVMGHGGSPRDRDSWKLNPSRAGGGALIDPGIHLLDLCHIASGGPLELLGGTSWSGFWKTGIEEECRLLLRGSSVPMIDVTVSVARWRSTFRMELFGEDGYGIVQGRGRSYGPQEYRRGRRWGWQAGKSQAETEELVVTTPAEDSFTMELSALLFEKPENDAVSRPCSLDEALANMTMLETIRTRLGLPSLPQQTVSAA